MLYKKVIILIDMKFYPVFINIEGKRCVVVGGGRVAERKVQALLECGADVVVVSPALTGCLKEFKRKGLIEHMNRRYRDGDLKGAFLVVSATDSQSLNEKVFGEAEKEGLLINVVDRPGLCNFIVPSVVRRGDVTIAISTSGSSPYTARWLRERVEEFLPEEFAKVVEIVGAVRKMMLKEKANNDKKLRIFRQLLESPLLEYIRRGDRRSINTLLREVTGLNTTLSKLGIKIEERKP